MNAPALEVRDLTVRRGDVVALEQVSLTVAAGRVTALVGPNGAGKSTLLGAVTGLVAPLAGTVAVGGTDVAAARRRRAIAFVGQDDTVDRAFPLTVADVVAQGRPAPRPLRRTTAADRRAVADALTRVGLADLGRRPIGELSGGQRRRALVARALVQDAELLVLDEPFAGVDVASAAILAEVVRERAGEGAAVLVSTHDLGGVADLADDVVVLARRVLAQGPPSDVLTPAVVARAFGLTRAPEDR